MRQLIFVVAVMVGSAMTMLPNTEAAVVLDAVSIQVHTPPASGGGSPQTKAQFVMRNDSDPGVKILSILFSPTSPLFFDTAAGAPGVSPFRNFEVPEGGTYTAGGMDIVVGDDSDLTTGYTGPYTISDGATSFLLTFDDFDTGEAFAFWSDIDKGDGVGGDSITAADWNGSSVTIVFDNGCEVTATWDIPENNGRTYPLHGIEEECEIEGPVVPEPSSLALLAFGMGAFGGFKRWKRRS